MSTPEHDPSIQTVEAPVTVLPPAAPAAVSAEQTPVPPPASVAPAPSPPASESTDPVKIERAFRPRTDDDVPFGTFAEVISGEHEGRYGVYTNTAQVDEHGIPTRVILRTRDDRDENLLVPYDAIRPSVAGKR